MNTPWTQHVWQNCQPVYQSILKHPFLVELQNGQLAKERFYFYLAQDAIYLNSFGKALSGIATRLHDANQIEAFLGFAKDCIAVERALHQSYLQDAEGLSVKASPNCLLYTSYVLRLVLDAPVEVAVASVLPCFRIYQEVGDYLQAHPTAGNPWQAWIDTYSGEEYGKAVQSAEAIANTLAEQASDTIRTAMDEAFLLCARMEWMFWDSAYHLQAWPV